MDFDPPPLGKQSGFTLIELLMVLAIVGILMGAVAGVSVKLFGSMRITQAVEIVVGEINYARQAAAVSNAVVKVCFIQAVPSNEPGGTVGFCGIGSRLVKNDGTQVWLRKISWFPAGIVLADASKYSNILAPASSGGVAVSTISPADPRFSTYVGISIRPNGQLEAQSTALLPTSPWFVTVLAQKDLQAATVKNCGVVQIDPLTARTSVFRP